MATTKEGKKKQRAEAGLTERAIERHVGERSFRLGESYFHSRAVFDCRRQGELLKGRCYGRSADYYVLTARVDGNRILEAECSCPVGGGGTCKHVAALLLTWLHRPDEFRETEPLEKRLSGCSKSKLIGLIEQMVEQEPDLESWLDLALPAAVASDAVVKPDDYRRQTVAAFAGAGYGWEADQQLTAALEALRKIGDQFRRQQKFESAAAVYSGILDGFIGEYETFHDETGDVVSAAGACIAALGKCLPHLAEGTETRESAVRALFEVLRFDVNFGGIGLSDNVPDILLKQATPAERETIAGWIREVTPGGNDFSSKWRRETWGGLLLDLQGEPDDDEAFVQHCREFGLTGNLVERLLQRGKLEDALKEIAAASDYELTGHADRLIAHNHADLAHDLVRERLSNESSRDNGELRDWLKRFYKSQKNWKPLLELCIDEFRRRPNLPKYQEVRKYAKKLKTWDSLRPEMMSSVPQDSAELIRIHLDEGEISQAIERLESHSDGRRFIATWDRVDLEVAQAAEKPYPESALKIYQAEAEGLIGMRGRGNYRTACHYLKKIRRLFKTSARNGEWEAYISNLRAENRSLHALQDELNQAGL
ncbi:MAG: hypothetical protein GYA33_04110 [Thermogutta sp.]|nr:hypothetical protein [Thermogutta sp.]